MCCSKTNGGKLYDPHKVTCVKPGYENYLQITLATIQNKRKQFSKNYVHHTYGIKLTHFIKTYNHLANNLEDILLLNRHKNRYA
jgi:hypothetical protein